ncbi:MAG: hypothetical protein ACOYJG_12980 [Prevotella sp.]|jgi:hypothetical protein
MKKFFILLLSVFVFQASFAQDVSLTYSNLDQENSTNDLYKFTGTDFTLTMQSRDFTKHQDLGDFVDGINFKNNSVGTINIPTGVKVYRIEMAGFSQSTDGNWCYLAGWGEGDSIANDHGFIILPPNWTPAFC